ncbi:MAG: hypothetical protein WA817_20750 [Candidatus Acidiferrum sp.]
MDILMHERRLERVLVRCRLLIRRSAIHRLGIWSMEARLKNYARFIAECHRAYKRAAEILIVEMLILERAIAQTSEDGDTQSLHRQKYWLHILELAFDSFVWIAANHDRSNVTKIYKGSKFGLLSQQNIESVIETANELNTSENVFAFPLDFSRFSCIGDLLRITRDATGEVALAFIEVKEGRINERIFEEVFTKKEQSVEKLAAQFDDKGIKQIQRMQRQEQVALKQLKYFDARPGIYKGKDENRIISELRIGAEDRYDDLIELLMHRARQGEFSSEIVDDCVVVTALNATSAQRYSITDFSSRATVHAAFLANGPSKSDGELVNQMENIRFIDWMEALHSPSTVPPLLRPLSTRSFLDLMTGRIQLRFYFDPGSFLRLCRDQKIQAGFVRKKVTNRLRTTQCWKKDQVPIFDGRALGYLAGRYAGIIGWGFIHEILFNWRTPKAIVRHLSRLDAEVEQLGGPHLGQDVNRDWFSDKDLELV